jgi:phosphoserine phosphatase RsbU/P
VTRARTSAFDELGKQSEMIIERTRAPRPVPPDGGGAFVRDELPVRTLAERLGAAFQRLLRPEPQAEGGNSVAADPETIRDDGLFMQTPLVPGFDIAGWNLSADAAGGDFFDFEEQPSGRLAIAVADVCGHDVDAGLLGEKCRALLGATLAETEDPGQVLSTINGLLVESQTQGRFVTVFLGLLDHDEHQLRYVSAGHGPVWLYANDSRVFRELEVQDYPLALEAQDAPSAAGIVSFAPGDLLVIVTDGFYEATDAQGHCFGIERLQDLIRLQHERSAAEMIHSLYEDVLAFAGTSPQRDDLTAVIIKRR